MAIILSKAALNDQLRIVSYTCKLNDTRQSSKTEDGVHYTAATGAILWGGFIACSEYTSDGNRRIEAIIRKLQTPGTYFNFTPKKAWAPQNYTGVGFTAVQANGTQSAGRTLALKGLPINFQLFAGDLLSFNIAGINRMYEIEADVKASATGTVSVVLSHAMPVGSLPAANATITFLNPMVTCMVVPKSISWGTVGLASTSGCQFDFIQAIR